MARKHGVDRGLFQRPDREGFWVQLMVDGRRRTYKCDTITQARHLYTRLTAEKLEGRLDPKGYRATPLLTLKQWIDRRLDGSSNRDRQHEKQRALYWASVWGVRPLPAISFEDLRQHRAKMLASGDYSPATVNRYYSSLRRVLTLAVQDGKLDRHPMKGLRFLPEPQQDRFFSEDELSHLQKLLPADEWREVAIALGTCLRLSEQFGLQWKHVNEEGRTLSIPLPKGNRTRRVPISEEVMGLLRQQFSDSPWVFPDPLDPMQPQDPYQFAARFKTRLNQAGIASASWHVLRHSGASRLLRAGVDIVTVSKILGHSVLQTTMRYIHFVKSHLHEAVNQVSVSRFAEAEKTVVGTTTRTTTKPVHAERAESA